MNACSASIRDQVRFIFVHDFVQRILTLGWLSTAPMRLVRNATRSPLPPSSPRARPEPSSRATNLHFEPSRRLHRPPIPPRDANRRTHQPTCPDPGRILGLRAHVTKRHTCAQLSWQRALLFHSMYSLSLLGRD